MCYKEEGDEYAYETVSYPKKRRQGELITIYVDTVGKGCGMFEKVMHLYIIYIYIYILKTSTYMVEEQVMKEIDPYTEGEDDFIISGDMEEHWREAEEE